MTCRTQQKYCVELPKGVWNGGYIRDESPHNIVLSEFLFSSMLLPFLAGYSSHPFSMYNPGRRYFDIWRYHPGQRYYGILRYYPGREYFGVSFGTALGPMLKQLEKDVWFSV